MAPRGLRRDVSAGTRMFTAGRRIYLPPSYDVGDRRGLDAARRAGGRPRRFRRPPRPPARPRLPARHRPPRRPRRSRGRRPGGGAQNLVAAPPAARRSEPAAPLVPGRGRQRVPDGPPAALVVGPPPPRCRRRVGWLAGGPGGSRPRPPARDRSPSGRGPARPLQLLLPGPAPGRGGPGDGRSARHRQVTHLPRSTPAPAGCRPGGGHRAMKDELRRAFDASNEAPHPSLRSALRARLEAGPPDGPPQAWRMVVDTALVVGIVGLAVVGGLALLPRGGG